MTKQVRICILYVSIKVISAFYFSLSIRYIVMSKYLQTSLLSHIHSLEISVSPKLEYKSSGDTT